MSALRYDGGNITHYSNRLHTLDHQYDTNLNRLGSVSGGLSRSFQYDARGNVIHNGARAFTFNRANQLVASGSHAYLYDGMNRRVKTQDGLGTRYWFYDAGGRLLYRETAGQSTNYIYLGKRLIAREGVLQQDGRPQHHSPYGGSIETPRDDLGYAGHQFDTQLSLTYMQARYYDPAIGRFYSNDPVGFSASDLHSFNRYAYANNNPYKYIDPDGRAADFFLDLGFIAYSAYTLATEPSWTNAAALGVDVVGAAVPLATGLGTAVRAGAHGADTVKGADAAVDAARGTTVIGRFNKATKTSTVLGPARTAC